MFGGAETVVLSAKELVEPESLLVLLAKKLVEPEQLLTGLGPVVDFPAVSLAEDFLFLPKQDVVVDQQFPILMTNVKFEGTNKKKSGDGFIVTTHWKQIKGSALSRNETLLKNYINFNLIVTFTCSYHFI